MLLPQEQPVIDGLNNYYLQIDKFIEHLQGEIGSGCIYCQAVDKELLIYFDEDEIIQAVIQQSGKEAETTQSLEPVMKALAMSSFQVKVYYLDANAIFFWAQMPSFKRAKGKLKSSDITLPDLVFRLSQKQFTGFIEIDLQGRNDCAILFFHQGERRGGSYHWGRGGLSPSHEDYNSLLGMLHDHIATYAVGHFTTDPARIKEPESSVTPQAKGADKNTLGKDASSGGKGGVGNGEYFSDLNSALNEFLDIYIRIAAKKIKTDPLIQLKLKFIDAMADFSSLAPYNNFYTIDEKGSVTFVENAPEQDIATGMVSCAWMVIEDVNLEKKFRAELNKWAYRTALEERDIVVVREF